MLTYIVRRLLLAVPLILGIVTATFFLVHLAPGDPVDLYLQPQRQVDPAVIERVRQERGLDQPLHIQYVNWLSASARGDFGESFLLRRPVRDVLAETVPYTLLLILAALLVDALLGISLGVVSAVKRGTKLDRVVTLGSLVLYAMPGFWLALMLILLFSVGLGWFPTSQATSLDYADLSAFGKVLDRLWHLVLPVTVLGVGGAAATARYMRSRLLDVLGEEYITAARARGFRGWTIIRRHALKNAMIPIITIYGMSLPLMLGGATIVETIFAWPGMGRLTVDAVVGRDYPVILATTMVAAVLTVLGSLLADVGYAAVDPRVSYERSRP
ncbi:MAG: ABC transporter permease [Gemmatimonadetes bacterium]|nr:ABC transporter permease [Gemmatimonadota bacterium]